MATKASLLTLQQRSSEISWQLLSRVRSLALASAKHIPDLYLKKKEFSRRADKPSSCSKIDEVYGVVQMKMLLIVWMEYGIQRDLSK